MNWRQVMECEDSVSTVIYMHQQDRPDSIEIGTPGKRGALKVYFNASRPEEAEQLIRNAYEALERGRELMEQG